MPCPCSGAQSGSQGIEHGDAGRQDELLPLPRGEVQRGAAGADLHKDERTDEDIGRLDVVLELGKVGRVAQLLEYVARAFDRYVRL